MFKNIIIVRHRRFSQFSCITDHLFRAQFGMNLFLFVTELQGFKFFFLQKEAQNQHDVGVLVSCSKFVFHIKRQMLGSCISDLHLNTITENKFLDMENIFRDEKHMKSVLEMEKKYLEMKIRRKKSETKNKFANLIDRYYHSIVL